MLLFERTLQLVPEQTKTNCVYEIPLEQDFEKIIIDAAYSPKRVEDPEIRKRLIAEGLYRYRSVLVGTKEADPEIVNMICLSADLNGRFCGYAHRHDPVQHIVIAEREATPGFHRIRPEKGILKITLAVCLVATPVCTYRLRVCAE